VRDKFCVRGRQRHAASQNQASAGLLLYIVLRRPGTMVLVDKRKFFDGVKAVPLATRSHNKNGLALLKDVLQLVMLARRGSAVARHWMQARSR